MQRIGSVIKIDVNL